MSVYYDDDYDYDDDPQEEEIDQEPQSQDDILSRVPLEVLVDYVLPELELVDLAMLGKTNKYLKRAVTIALSDRYRSQFGRQPSKELTYRKLFNSVASPADKLAIKQRMAEQRRMERQSLDTPLGNRTRTTVVNRYGNSRR